MSPISTASKESITPNTTYQWLFLEACAQQIKSINKTYSLIKGIPQKIK
jgi:hypothetical protein